MNAFDYRGALSGAISALNPRDINAFIAHLRFAQRNNYPVYLCGNGGSASTVNHFATDLLKVHRIGAISLASNAALLTAYGNDIGFASIFAKQLEVIGGSAGVFIALSVSGRSPNVVEAAKVARQMGLTCIGLTAHEGGALSDWLDTEIRVPVRNYGLAEDVHLMLCHMAIEALKEQEAL